MKRISLTQGKFAIVDDTDFEWLMQWKWCAHKYSHIYYATRSKHVCRIKGKQIVQGFRMHREILSLGKGDSIIDHINGNGLDNRRRNLRCCTHRQNCQNRHSARTSIHPGVSFEKQTYMWKAQMQTNGVNKNLGRFELEEDAAEAYIKAYQQIRSKI